MINFSTLTKEDFELISSISKRAQKEIPFLFENGLSVLTLNLDLEATHVNNGGLRLKELLEADISEFAHDICGIVTHMNRETGELDDLFVPRYSK